MTSILNHNAVNSQIERIQDHEIDLNQLLAMQHFPECGGLALFAGTIRNHQHGKAVQSLKYTAYKPLAEKMIRQIEQEIEQKYAVSYVRVVHRIGHLNIGEVAIYAVARADHRREAFAACEEAVERVKHEVPVWKEEFYTDGSSVFVEGCCIRTDFADVAQKNPLSSHSHEHQQSSHQNHRSDQSQRHSSPDHPTSQDQSHNEFHNQSYNHQHCTHTPD